MLHPINLSSLADTSDIQNIEYDFVVDEGHIIGVWIVAGFPNYNVTFKTCFLKKDKLLVIYALLLVWTAHILCAQNFDNFIEITIKK